MPKGMRERLYTRLHEKHVLLSWQWAPKIIHTGLPTVKLATYLAVGIFTDGAGTGVLEELQIQPGVHCVATSKKLDREQLYHSVKKSSEKAKRGGE